METYLLKEDLKLFCIKARSFPHDIKEAFDKLINLLPTTDGRTFFGISYQTSSGEIIYKAAVLESYEGEGVSLGCESYTVKKGEYLAETIYNWMKDVTSIGSAFRKMVDSRSDTTFPCVEWYQGDDVMCMVRIEKRVRSDA